MLHEGKKYVIRTTNKVTGTTYYNCRHFRQGCLAKLISKREHVRARGEHNCENLLPIQVMDVSTLSKNTRKGMGCDMLHSLDKAEARWLSDSDKRSFVRFNTGWSVKNKERRI
ncbi:hypothetical protein PPTG_24837, partial [Phytophthora nicotianae INRA-310]